MRRRQRIQNQSRSHFTETKRVLSGLVRLLWGRYSDFCTQPFGHRLSREAPGATLSSSLNVASAVVCPRALRTPPAMPSSESSRADRSEFICAGLFVTLSFRIRNSPLSRYASLCDRLRCILRRKRLLIVLFPRSRLVTI